MPEPARPNIFDPDLEWDSDDPDGYRAGMDRMGPKLGAERLGASVYELPPGQAICPYHYELSEEEWLIVLSGSPTLRGPKGEEELRPGEVVCFPPGPGSAHKISNGGGQPARVLMFSEVKHPAISVYPDSDKIGVYTGGDRGDDRILRREPNLEYFDGEDVG